MAARLLASLHKLRDGAARSGVHTGTATRGQGYDHDPLRHEVGDLPFQPGSHRSSWLPAILGTG